MTSPSSYPTHVRPTSCARRGRHPPCRVRTVPRSRRRPGTSVTHSPADRFDWLYTAEELAEWVEPVRAGRGGGRGLCDVQQQPDDFAPRSAAIFRGLLDEAGIPVTGAIEPPSTELTLF